MQKPKFNHFSQYYFSFIKRYNEKVCKYSFGKKSKRVEEHKKKSTFNDISFSNIMKVVLT